MERLVRFLQIKTTRAAWIFLLGSLAMFLFGVYALRESGGVRGPGLLVFAFWFLICGLYIAIALWTLFSAGGQQYLAIEQERIAIAPRYLLWYAKFLFACFAAGFASSMLLGVLALPFAGYRVLLAMFQPNGGMYWLFLGFLWAPLIFRHLKQGALAMAGMGEFLSLWHLLPNKALQLTLDPSPAFAAAKAAAASRAAELGRQAALVGVTIHFEGSLRDESAYSRLIEKAQAFSDLNSWPTTPILEQSATLTRVRDTEEAWDYVGPTKGIEIRPHENADPLRLEFDSELYMQEFCKTQFAPPHIHASIVELLRSVAAEFSNLSVEDEGELWDTGDFALLQRHLEACFNAIDAHLKENPDHYGPVRVQGGRIVDLMERE